MSEFTCICGEIILSGLPCPNCGDTKPYRMDGLTNSEWIKEEQKIEKENQDARGQQKTILEEIKRNII